MAKPVRGLGRGYDALISGASHGAQGPAAAAGPPLEVDIGLIDPSPWQPRTGFDDALLRELADSIASQGLLVPLGVRARAGRYELVHGERRLRALRLLGRGTAPVALMDLADAHVREAALVENLQRADLGPIETAMAYQALLAEHGYTQEAMAQRLGLTRQQVGNTLRLLGLPAEIRQMLAEGALSAGQARALLALPDDASRLRLAKRAAAEGLSVRELEKLSGGSRADPRSAGRRGKGGRARPAPGEAAREALDLAERLGRRLGVPVEVQDAGGAGKIILPYSSPAEAARLAALMGLET